MENQNEDVSVKSEPSHESKMDNQNEGVTLKSDPSQTALTNNFSVVTRYMRKGKGRVHDASMMGPALRSILKQKGDQTAGKRSIALRKSSIKFNKYVCTREQSPSDEEFDPENVDSAKRFPVSLPPEDVNKYVIENTLIKSAEILSDFTENAITKGSSYMHSFIASDRFRIKSPYHQRRSRAWTESSANVSAVPTVCSLVAQKRHLPDFRKLPRNIVELLQADSDSSVLSNGNIKQYHSRKMALRQNNVSNRPNNGSTKFKSFVDTKAPDILIVTAPIDSKFRLPSLEKDSSGNANNESQPSEVEGSLEPSNKTVKMVDASVGMPNKPLRKPHKIFLGVENGVVFVLGPKTKSINYSNNTFGEAKELKNSVEENLAYRRWVFNIGNFSDNEISFSLLEKNLTITGFRHPTLQYPDGQTTSQTVAVPDNFDAKNVYIYRPTSDNNDILVVEEADGKPK